MRGRDGTLKGIHVCKTHACVLLCMYADEPFTPMRINNRREYMLLFVCEHRENIIMHGREREKEKDIRHD